MRKYYLICYDLKKPGQNYSELYDEIKSLGDWRHPMESTWVVHTEGLSTVVIRERLKKKMDLNDSVFVVDITTSDYAGWLTNTFWEWFRKQQ